MIKTEHLCLYPASREQMETMIASEQWDFEHCGIQDWLPKVNFRGYRDEDYEAVCDFLIELNQKDRTHINWNWARFEWMMEHPEFDQSARSSIGLWWSEGRVIGAAIYDMYFGEAFCAALTEYKTLYPDILDYAYRELKDDSGLAVAIHQENTAEIRAAELAGFERIDQRETIMELSLDRDFSSNLPEGLQLREMDQIADRDALERLNVRWTMFRMSEGISTKPCAFLPWILPESRYRTAPSGFIRIRTMPM